MLTCVDVKFIFDSVRLGLSIPANILQIADVALRVVFLLFLPCVQQLSRLFPAVVLTLEKSKMSAFIFFTTKTTLPHPQVFSVTVPQPVAGCIFDVITSLNKKFRKASPLMVDPHSPLPLPLSQGLDPAQQCTYYRKVLLSSSYLNGHT